MTKEPLQTLHVYTDALPTLTHLHVPTTDSTNKVIHRLQPTPTTDIVLISADHQTAGRGQMGNTWHDADGQNLLFSFVVHPTFVPLTQQFILSQASALSIWQALSALTEGITIKWPNDIYWYNHKLSGTLIENELTGRELSMCIMGTGINVNQTEFHPLLPNPTSLRLILGHEVNREALLQSIIGHFRHNYLQVMLGRYDEIRQPYKAHLYRADGFYPYADAQGIFQARITGIKEDGHLLLTDTDGRQRSYLFKEVRYVHQNEKADLWERRNMGEDIKDMNEHIY